jgi:hypothetical protein
VPLELLALEDELELVELLEELELELEEEDELLVLEELLVLLDELLEELEVELLLELDELLVDEVLVPPQADKSSARQAMAKCLFMKVTGYCADCLMKTSVGADLKTDRTRLSA